MNLVYSYHDFDLYQDGDQYEFCGSDGTFFLAFSSPSLYEAVADFEAMVEEAEA